MKTEFTLNFDEFLEAHEARSGKTNPTVTASIVFFYVVVASGLLAFGLWTGFKSTANRLEAMQARAMSQGLVAAGLLLLAGYPLLSRWRRKTDRKSSEQLLRDEFARVEDDVREFQADDKGWSYRSQTGLDYRSWETFAWIWQGDKIITLVSHKDAYLLPKRVFSEEQLAEFLGLVDKVFQERAARGVFSARLQASAWDYAIGAARATRSLYSPPVLVLLVIAMAGTAALFIYQLLYWERIEGGGSTLLLSGSCTLLVLWCLLSPLTSLKRYRRDVERAPCIDATITPDAILLMTPKSYRILRLDSLHKYRTTSRVFLLYHNDEYFEMLPTRGLDSQQLRTVRGLLSARISPGARKAGA